jgi:hypothetical protein
MWVAKAWLISGGFNIGNNAFNASSAEVNAASKISVQASESTNFLRVD